MHNVYVQCAIKTMNFLVENSSVILTTLLHTFKLKVNVKQEKSVINKNIVKFNDFFKQKLFQVV